MSDYSSVIKSEFSGFWNLVFIIAVLVVCLRFSDAAWGSADFDLRLQGTFYLFGLVIALSSLFAIFRLILLKLKPPQHKYGHPYLTAIARAFKYGFVLGGLLVTTIGVLMVDNFLNPFQDLIDRVFSIL